MSRKRAKDEMEMRQIANDVSYATFYSLKKYFKHNMTFQNPFDTVIYRPHSGMGYKEWPIPITCLPTENSRMVGCYCQSDYPEVVWFQLEKGEPQRCDCGYYFTIIEHDPMDNQLKPKYGKGFGSGMMKHK